MLREQQQPFQDEPAECRLCGVVSLEVLEYEIMGGFPCCGECGEVIANAFWKRHSGKYLTWPDEPRGVVPGYKKPIPEALRWQVFARDGYKCLHCGAPSFLRADHIHPESKGEQATLENLQTLCNSCNLSKGAKVNYVKPLGRKAI